MPSYSREQVRRRQRVVLAVAAVIVLLLVGGCTRILIGVFGDGRGAFEADDEAMSVPGTPADAAAHEQLPEGVVLEADEVMGIDVSSYQQEIDWEQVAGDGYGFAYIKATEGAGYTDERVTENWEGAQAAGVTPGAYHYFTLCSPGAEQAEDFLAAVPPDDTALPPALDLEFDGVCDERPEAEDAQAEIDAFTAAVEEAWGRRMVVYSSSQWREHYGLPVTDSRPDWLYADAARPTSEDWAIWQLRFDGEVAGIEGEVDIDVARIEVLRAHAEIPAGEEELTHAPEQ